MFNRHNHYSLPSLEQLVENLSAKSTIFCHQLSHHQIHHQDHHGGQTGMERTKTKTKTTRSMVRLEWNGPDKRCQIYCFGPMCAQQGDSGCNSIWTIIVGISNVLQPANTSRTLLHGARGWATVVGTSTTNLSPCVQPTG